MSYNTKNTPPESYVCPKCRGRQPDVREVILAKSGLFDLLPSRDNRYIEVTCSLCGYTEFYNRALYAAARALETEARKSPVPDEAGQ